MPERNVELLERTMQYIVDHPEAHKQHRWFARADCGTAACYAGWACLLSGYKVEDIKGPHSFNLVAPDGAEVPLAVLEVDEHRPGVSKEARDLLGLTFDEAEMLFEATNTVGMLRLMVKDLVNGDDLRDSHEYEEEAEG